MNRFLFFLVLVVVVSGEIQFFEKDLPFKNENDVLGNDAETVSGWPSSCDDANGKSGVVYTTSLSDPMTLIASTCMFDSSFVANIYIMNFDEDLCTSHLFTCATAATSELSFPAQQYDTYKFFVTYDTPPSNGDFTFTLYQDGSIFPLNTSSIDVKFFPSVFYQDFYEDSEIALMTPCTTANGKTGVFWRIQVVQTVSITLSTNMHGSDFDTEIWVMSHWGYGDDCISSSTSGELTFDVSNTELKYFVFVTYSSSSPPLQSASSFTLSVYVPGSSWPVSVLNSIDILSLPFTEENNLYGERSEIPEDAPCTSYAVEGNIGIFYEFKPSDTVNVSASVCLQGPPGFTTTLVVMTRTECLIRSRALCGYDPPIQWNAYNTRYYIFVTYWQQASNWPAPSEEDAYFTLTLFETLPFPSNIIHGIDVNFWISYTNSLSGSHSDLAGSTPCTNANHHVGVFYQLVGNDEQWTISLDKRCDFDPQLFVMSEDSCIEEAASLSLDPIFLSSGRQYFFFVTHIDSQPTTDSDTFTVTIYPTSSPFPAILEPIMISELPFVDSNTDDSGEYSGTPCFTTAHGIFYSYNGTGTVVNVTLEATFSSSIFIMTSQTCIIEFNDAGNWLAEDATTYYLFVTNTQMQPTGDSFDLSVFEPFPNTSLSDDSAPNSLDDDSVSKSDSSEPIDFISSASSINYSIFVGMTIFFFAI